MRIRLLLVVLAVAVVAWILHAFAHRPFAQQTDYAWFLDVARHLLDGRGLTSNMIYPAFLYPGSAEHLDRQPFISNPPLPLLLLAGAMAVLGPNEVSGAGYGFFSYLALVGATALAASVLTRDLRTVVPSAALVALEPRVLEHSLLAGTDLLFAAVSVLLLTFAARATMRPTKTSLATSALALAFAEGVRFTAVAFLPAICIVLWLYVRRVLPVIAIVAAFVIAYGLFAAGGDPSRVGGVLAVQRTSLYPGDSSQGTLDSITVGLIAERPGPFIEKWLSNLRTNLQEIARAATPYAVGASLLAGVMLWRLRTWRPILLFLVLSLGTTVVLTTVTQTGARLYLPFVPFAFLLIVAACVSDLRLGRLALAIMALLVITSSVLDMGAAFRRQHEREARFADVAAIAAELRARAGPRDWTATDLPEEMAWRADRPVLRLPNDRDTLSRIEERHRRVDFVLLTTERIHSATYLPSSYWAEAFASDVLEGYDLTWTFDGSIVKAKLFRRSGDVP